MKIKCLALLCAFLLLLASCKKDVFQQSQIQKITTDSIPTKPSHFTVANTLQSNMVVQRNKPLIVWGTAIASVIVTVNVSWAANPIQATTNSVGKWQVSVPVGAADANPQTITVSTPYSKTVNLTNILIGDVWICSGQSNMVMQVDSIAPFQGVTNYKEEIAAANYPNIRALTVAQDYETNPVDTLVNAASWTICSPQTAGNLSAVAYFFAQKLNVDLNVPIGIIISAVNGTSCEAWTNKAAFTANPYLVNYSDINFATQLFNGMINPLSKLSISGFIWYQGENNKKNNPVSDYTKLNSALIIGWRNIFNQGTLPFYLVQMTPFAEDYFDTTPVGGDLTSDDYAKFREAQANVLAVANTGMAITMDVGVPANQHPSNKKPIGERLALLALKNTYNQNVQCLGPQFSSFSTSGNTATITFKPGTSTGLNTINNALLNQYFFIANSSQSFVKATATINNDEIVLTAPVNFTPPIVAIRYAFTNAPVTNLQNSAGLPMEPFRTDTWSN